MRCPKCKGNGRVEMLEHCPQCRGTGEVPDTLADSLEGRITELEAENQRLREAIEPFARHADNKNAAWEDSELLTLYPTVGEVRAARRATQALTPTAAEPHEG